VAGASARRRSSGWRFARRPADPAPVQIIAAPSLALPIDPGSAGPLQGRRSHLRLTSSARWATLAA